MFGNLFFNLKRKNDTTYLTTNFLVPIYIMARSKMKCNTSGRRQTEVRDGQKVQTIDARSAKPDTA
ncbi:hypothetical protein, partial [Acidithiobacillus thiooxidans]